ncbi:hypothetical protein [Undibacterium sp.]|uniref:hypothetical protein n=1 Tax=Undibacterium sp. TaxID=1914977 RepID=UPI00374D1BEC
MLAGCGGGSGEGTAKIPNQAAERNVAVADLPSLSDCLSQIDAALLKDPRQRTVGLFCLQGTLRGLTADGSACALKIDADTGVFRFDFGRQSVSLKWQDIVFPPNGPAIHNLENAGTPAQPGVRLTQFTGGSKPVTEAIMLRAGVRGGSGPSAMPTISYQYTQNDQPSLVECRFGK